MRNFLKLKTVGFLIIVSLVAAIFYWVALVDDMLLGQIGRLLGISSSDTPPLIVDQTTTDRPETERTPPEPTAQPKPAEAITTEATSDLHTASPASAPPIPPRPGVREPNDRGSNADTFRITGHLVNSEGLPVQGVKITASARHLFVDDTASFLPDPSGAQETLSDASGAFQFRDLANGEYELRTEETSDHPLAASTQVRAGSTSIKLLIVEQREIWVDGYVATQDWAPLGLVNVYTGDSKQSVAVSDPTGFFGFSLLARSDKGNSIRLTAEGFQDATVSITPNEWMQSGVARIDIALSPLDALATITGAVTDQDGTRLPAKKIYLRRSGKSYETITNNQGEFEIKGIQAPSSYSLMIPAAGHHDAYSRAGLEVPRQGLHGLEIILDTLGYGNVRGLFIDPNGSPVQNFNLIARSQAEPFHPIPVRSNGEGYFFIEGVPAGWVRIESESEPRFVIEGIKVESDSEVEVNPVIDIGANTVSGKVTDLSGEPVPAATLQLVWRFKEGDVTHQSIRNTVSDASGRFLFGGLGQTPRSLYVSASGYRSQTIQVQAGVTITTVRLDPAT